MELDDVIYGKIQLPHDVAAIVKTPHFQRLKNIRQMGFLKLDNVREYDANRYYHSIGTYHAACRMLEALEKNTPWLSDNNNQIPQPYRRAVEIAALLHDIGHGPFSHTWEYVAEGFEHENFGLFCVDAIFASIDKELFPELRANECLGIRVIKAIIRGEFKDLLEEELPSKFEFIFEIVCNKRCGMDVDKWDYLKRDHYFIKDMCDPNMDFDDIFLKARATVCGGSVEYRYEDYNKFYNLFAARWQFHKNCYQLPRNLICDKIFKTIIEDIQPQINGTMVCNINGRADVAAFLQLTDSRIMSLIEEHQLVRILDYDTTFREVEPKELVKETNELFIVYSDISNIAPCLRKMNFVFYGNKD